MSALISMLFYLLQSPAAGAQSKSDPPLKVEIRKILYLDAAIDFERTPGLIIGGRHQGQPFQYAFGFRDSSQVDTIRSADLFCIGEVSQLFVALLCHHLAEAGRLHLEDSLAQVLPSASALKDITIRQLLNHQAALPTLPNNLGEGPEAYSKSDLEQWFQSAPMLLDSTLDYRFSNLHYALIQYVLEAKTGQSLEQLLESYLTGELGMRQTTVFRADLPISPGHNKAGLPLAPEPYAAFQGAKGLLSNMDDLLIFADWLLKTYENPELEAYWNSNRIAAAPKIKKRLYAGQGWHLLEVRKFPTIWLHTGTANGHRAFIALVPETQTAVVVLSNSPQGLNGFGYLVLRMLNNNWKVKRKDLK